MLIVVHSDVCARQNFAWNGVHFSTVFHSFDDNMNNSVHLARKYMLGYLSADIICFEKGTVSESEI